jgi:hypothetical protein
MRHPDDPSDSIWSAYRDYGRFGNYFVATIDPGKPLTVRYRFRITVGDAPVREVLTAKYQDYAKWGAGLAGFSDADGSWDNSFLIADGDEACILEAVDKEWAARRVTKGVANIGNFMTIRTEWNLCSKNMVKTAVQRRWWPAEKADKFDFAVAYHDFKTPLAPAIVRGKRVHSLVAKRHGRIDLPWGF